MATFTYEGKEYKLPEFSYEGKEYSLGFNRKTAEAAQAAGLNIEELTSKPLVMGPLLFFWSFKMNHPNIKKSKTDEIYEHAKNRMGVLNVLTINYISTYAWLFDDGEGDENLIDLGIE